MNNLYISIYLLFSILYLIKLTNSQISQTTEKKELEFLSSKLNTETETENQIQNEIPNTILKSKPKKNYQIVSQNEFCLSSNGQGNNLVQTKCKNFKKKLIWEIKDKFIFEKVNIIYNDDVIMENSDASLYNGNPVIGNSKRKGLSNRQLWKIESVNNGQSVSIRLQGTQYCLDNNNSQKAGTNYVIWECNKNNINQWFQLREFIS